MNKFGDQGYNPQYPQYNPGGSQPYAPPAEAPPYGYGGPPPPNNGFGGEKDPYEGDRFKPKKRINDPIFLVLFIAQVRRYMGVIGRSISAKHACGERLRLQSHTYIDTSIIVRWILYIEWDNYLGIHLEQWSGRRTWRRFARDEHG
jgi:hypothetical protein